MFLYFTINTESVVTEVFLSVGSIRLSPICVVSGVCLLHVSDSAVDGHRVQTPCQSSAAVLGLGARYHCHVHQQVWYTHTHTWPQSEKTESMWTFICPSNTIHVTISVLEDSSWTKLCLIPTWLGLWYTRLLSTVRFIIYTKIFYRPCIVLFVFLWNLWIVQHLLILENNYWRSVQYSA